MGLLALACIVTHNIDKLIKQYFFFLFRFESFFFFKLFRSSIDIFVIGKWDVDHVKVKIDLQKYNGFTKKYSCLK